MPSVGAKFSQLMKFTPRQFVTKQKQKIIRGKIVLTNTIISDMVNYISNEPYKQLYRKARGCENLQELFNQEKPIYLQIKEMIETDILREIFMEEERVPSTNELAKLYAINPATAAKGINLLVDEGVLYKKRGIGMFVTAGAKELIRKKRKEGFLKAM